MKHICIVITVLWMSTAIAPAQEEHFIPDANLRAVVEKVLREEIGLPEDIPLQKEHMEFLVYLFADNKSIRSLQGLEFAKNLEELDVGRNQIQDISPLANLPKFRRLILWDNQVSDLSLLASIPTLMDLNISKNPISDLRPLSKLTGLWRIKATGCQIRDVRPLSGLINMKELLLVSNSITDVSPLANLTQLEVLDIRDNPIVDFSALQHLNLTEYAYDPICDQTIDFPALPVEERVLTRTYPSIFQAWRGLADKGQPNDDELYALHDLHLTSDFSIISNLEIGKAIHQRRHAFNPSYIFLVEHDFYHAGPNTFPEDSNYWLRGDISGNRIRYGGETHFYINILDPDVQKMIVDTTVDYSLCGAFDGIFIDEFTTFGNVYKGCIDPNQMSEAMCAGLMEAVIHIFSEIRERVPDDFLILVNGGTGVGEIENFTEYVNGSFMEWSKAPPEGYTHSDLIGLEKLLLWNERNLRYPQVNCLEGGGIPSIPPDSPNNQRWMRVFTTLSLTHSNGYILYTTGQQELHGDHGHIWYDFWDADLGRPVGGAETKAQLYENHDGVFIREYTNGWAVYNRSGKEQEISLPIQTIGVASGITSITHTLPDLDGEMYLKTEVNADVNGDGVVNILDLVAVANAFGEAEPDLNGDGVVNILDLVIVANAF